MLASRRTTAFKQIQMKFTLRTLLIVVAVVASLCGAYQIGRGQTDYLKHYELRMEIRDRRIVQLWKKCLELEDDATIRLQDVENRCFDYDKRVAELERVNEGYNAKVENWEKEYEAWKTRNPHVSKSKHAESNAMFEKVRTVADWQDGKGFGTNIHPDDLELFSRAMELRDKETLDHKEPNQ
jgi:hypothetical protein